MGGDDEPERAPDAADLLDRDGVGQRVEAGPAFVLGERDAEPAHLAEPATMSVGKRRSRSCSSTIGATSASMKSRIVSRRRTCSGDEVEVHPRQRTTQDRVTSGPRQHATGLGASLPRMPGSERPRLPRRPSGDSRPSRARTATIPRRPSVATSSSSSASSARRRPTSSPPGSGRAGPGSSSSSGRSRRPSSSCAGRNATASADRGTCTT